MMKNDFIDSVVKELQVSSPFEHATFFKELKEFTRNRLEKETAILTEQQAVLQTFMNEHFPTESKASANKYS